jgi:small subunit ribosomal protein S6
MLANEQSGLVPSPQPVDPLSRDRIWRQSTRATDMVRALAIEAKACMCAASREPSSREIPKKAGGAPPFGRIASDRHGSERNARMPLYEHVFLARQDLSQAQVDALAASATEIVEQGGGKVAKTETWGLKSLAYKIDRNRKAHFVLLNLECPGAVVAELERQNRINEDVIRWLTVSVETHEEGPSSQMRKNERDRKRRTEREERI